MRKLMWFTVGFGVACGFCAWFMQDTWILPLCIIGGILALAGIPMKRIRPISLCGAGLVLGLLWCMLFRNIYLQPAITADGETVNATIHATDYSYETDYGAAFDGKVMIHGQTFSVRGYLNEKEVVVPGDRVTGSFRMRYTPGGAQSATYHPGKGIYLLAYQKGEAEILPSSEDTFYPAELARMIKDRLRELFDEDVFPFTQALLLGDSTLLDYETETALKISGIRHIIAVSGLHITILFSLINAVTFRKRFVTAFLGFPVLLLFAAVAGFTPSVTRASIMAGLMILAQLFEKEYDSPTALSFAALVMLIANPMVITSVSFQLSVGCVAGIQMFSQSIHEWLLDKLGRGKGVAAALKKWFAPSVSITLGAMSLTTPLCAWYFGAVSLIGILTNLLTLWIVNIIFNGLVSVCLISLISLEAAGFLAGFIGCLIRFVLDVSRFLSAVPMAAVYTKSMYIVAWLAFVYLLLTVFLCSRKRYPWVLVCCVILGLCVALFASWLEPLQSDLRVTVLDVGQGQSILLQSRGNTVLVDCGGDDDMQTADCVAETLLSQGINRLDAVILTHCDRDHAGGLRYLLTRVDTDMVFYPSTETISVENIQTFPVSEDLQLTFGDAKIDIFGPIYVEDSNENSLCVLFRYEDCDILITGDRGSFGESMLLQTHTLPDVELLIAGHHGSKHSTTDALLDAVRPEYIFVSAGAGNRYGHPASEMLERAAKYGCAVYRTDIHGTLTFRR